MKIRLGTKEDIPVIQEIVRITWPVTYGHILAKGQVDYMLDLLYNTPTLEQQMDEGHNFHLAEAGDKVVGFADVSKYKTEDSFKLHKLYVLPEYHGQKIGNFLIDYVIEQVKKANGRQLILNVNRFNKAKGFYEKKGFNVMKEEDIYIGNGFFMNDFVMELKV